MKVRKNMIRVNRILLFFSFWLCFTNNGRSQDPLEAEPLINIEDSVSETELPKKVNSQTADLNQTNETAKISKLIGTRQAGETNADASSVLINSNHKKAVKKLNALESSNDSDFKTEDTPSYSLKYSNDKKHGNLPDYAYRKSSRDDQFNDPNFEPKNKEEFKLLSLKKGTILHSVIENNILAYPNSQSPVTGVVTSGLYRGAQVIGTATLDEVTKRVNIEFHTVVLKGAGTAYAIKGITANRDGELGLKGEYKTEFWKWLWAEVLVRTAGGYADATVEREASFFGAYNAVPNPENAAKRGATKGLDTIGDRFSEKRRIAPEMTEVRGPVQITITVME